MATLATTTPVAHEAALAQCAAGGDGEAFATLYESYESRVLNLCFRILGSQDDAADATQEAFVSVLRRLPQLEGRELAFGSYVFTSARNACYDLIERRRRTEPSDEIAEHATPVGGAVGGGGIGFDPGDPEDDPERNILLDSRQEEIRRANLTLPERQREALALKEIEDLSYDEVAEIMGMNRNSVAQLISRARLNLRGALRGAALTAIVPNAPQCERAVALIAAVEDGELERDSTEGEWLADHLVGCQTCRLRREAMEEAGVSYRAWLPISAGPFLFRETMAEAAELVGADWSDVVARRAGSRSRAGAGAAGAGTQEGARAAILRHRRLDLALIALLGLVLVLVVFVGPTSDNRPTTAVVPAAQERPVAARDPEPGKPAEKPGKAAKKKGKQNGDGEPNRPAAAAPPEESTDEPDNEPASTGGESPAGTSAGGGAQQRASSDGKVDRDGNGDSKDGLTGDAAPEPPPPAEVIPETPPPPPPADTTPTDPRGCRDSAGVPIPCGTPPPPRRPPTGTPPPPPRTPPPRVP